MVKLYYYSNVRHTFVEATWIPLALTAGILLCSILFVYALKLNQSAGFFLEPPSIGPLIAENSILQQHVFLLSPRVHALENRMKKVRKQFTNLQAMLSSDEAFKVKARLPAPMATSFTSVRSPVHARFDEKGSPPAWPRSEKTE